MNKLNEYFKSRKFIFLFSAFLNLALIVFFKYFSISYFNHNDLIIVPVLGMLLGPYAIFGCLAVQLGYWLTQYSLVNIDSILLNGLILVVACNILWRLWYSIFNSHGYDTPNLKKSYNLIKFFVIFLMYIILTFSLFMLNGNSHFEDEIYSILVLDSAISVLLSIFMLYLFNHFKIPLYSPKAQFKKILPFPLYSVPLIFSFVLFGLYYFEIIDYNPLLLMILLDVIYIFRPFDEEVFKIKDDFSINIASKLIYSVFLVLFSFIVISLIVTMPIFIKSGLGIDDLLFSVSKFMMVLVVSFIIPVYLYMYFLERHVTNPINKISVTLSGEIDSSEDYKKIHETLNSINASNEIKTLADSLLGMENDLIEYENDLVNVTADKERFKTELELADSIQSSMIPTDFKDFCDDKNFKISGLMKPAREVGGDFYDYFQIDEDNIGFVIGDVSGKGIPAALVMVETMTLIQDYAKHYDDLSNVFFEVNNLLCDGNVEELFVTCWLAKLNTKTGELNFVNAGHNPPLIKNNGKFEYLNTKPNLVLAAMEDMPYKLHSMQLNPGDEIFLYTDGVTEANDDYSGFYGEDRLKNILNDYSNDDLNKIISYIEEDINEFCNNHDRFDDITMFVMRYEKK